MNVDLQSEVTALKRMLEVRNARIAVLEKALGVAREEICWWVSEHGCCAGREDDAMTVIDAALGGR